MKFAGFALLTVGFFVADAGMASAAWDNVFQPACNSCRPARSSFFAPPAPSACCPSVSYQQRCYYQPYTAYKQETVLQPVTTYRTSYYWAPVTTYKYTSYYDPCTGCAQQVATPCTSYQLRSQCNAVQSYVQRCQMVPYTAYRQSCYMEPVVSYSAPVCPTCPTGVSPAVSEPSTLPPQGLPERKPLPNISEDGKTLPPQNLPNTRNRVSPSNDIPLRMDRIGSNPNGQLRGTVVADDRITPRSGTRIFFASAAKKNPEYSAQADAGGRFAIELPAGEWTLYMTGSDGKPVYHSQINVKNNDQRLLTVVSR